MEKGAKVLTRVRSYLDKKNVSLSAKVYFVDAMSSMSLGLFASLLIVTIFGTLADIPGLAFLSII
jgi:hypothetical protein